jgi:NADH-quinone oxidoreductase subunit J
MAEVLFFIAAAGALAGAFGVINPPQNNPFYSVLSLVVHLLSLAALFLLLRSEFIAAAQVVVYAGAVMVLYVFVVAYIGGDEPMARPIGPPLRLVSVLFVGLLLIELCIVVLGSGLQAIDGEGAQYDAAFGTPAQIGEALLTRFLLPFELASILLTIAAVGAVVLARRRGGIGAEDAGDTVTAAELFLPPGTGSMREGVSGLPEVAGEASPPQIETGSGSSSRGEGGW